MWLSIFTQKMIHLVVQQKLKTLINSFKIQKLNCEIYGISKDNLKSHEKFKKKYKIKFDLLADEEKKVLRKYKAWGKKKFMGREFLGTIRSTFLIDKKGKIIKIWKDVKVKDHANEVLATLKNIEKK